MADLNEELRKLQDGDASSAREAASRRERLEALLGRILRGESTGDPIRDFLIVSEENTTSNYDKLVGLENRLKGRVGELVVAIVMEPRQIMTHSSKLGIEPHFFFGTLSGERLVFDLLGTKGRLQTPLAGLPTERGIMFGQPFRYHRLPEEWSGGLYFGYPICSLLRLEETMRPSFGKFESRSSYGAFELEILVGDAEILERSNQPMTAWKGNRWGAWLNPVEVHQAASKLGKSLPGGAEVIAQDLAEKKGSCEKRLKDLRREREDLVGRIEAVRQSLRSGGYMRQGAYVLVEDKDDVKVKTMADHRKLERLDRQIEDELKVAEKLGLEAPVVAKLKEILVGG